jgi:hypothetical protein
VTEDNINMPPTLPPPSPFAADASAAGTGHILNLLLKSPTMVAEVIAFERKGLLANAASLLALGIACHAVFGFAVGLFAGWPVAWMDAVKASLVGVCSLLLCFPSLYVFACVAGSPLSIPQAVVLGCSCHAMVGLLLVGLAPVAWLFAVSTASVPFLVILVLLLWLVAISFAARFVGKLREQPLFQRQGGIRMWLWILILVTLQMTTCMRPMLAKPETGWWTAEKKFFLAHFSAAFKDQNRAEADR